ncbi:MAG: glycosyltransferase [Candidatus Moraniibacteriota bacterium]
MKILFLNYEYPPLGGGAGNATQYLLREYAGMQDLEVHLVTSSVDESVHIISVAPNVTVHSVPVGKNGQNLHFQSAKDLLLYSWRGFWYANGLLQKERFDVIHAFFSVPCGFMAWRLSKWYGIPYIVSLRGADVPGYSERFTGLYLFLRPIIRNIWRHATRVIANSSGLRLLALQTNTGQRIDMIPNGIDTTEFKPDATREVDGIFRILCVSRITPRKGIRYLIEGFDLLKKRDPSKMELWIIGEGDELPELRKLVSSLGLQKSVKFFGRVAHEKLSVFYGLADVFVLPSLNEGMSNTMLEALASGLPIIATVTGGTEELVTDGENGLYIEKESPTNIALKLEIILMDEGLRKKMGEASRVRAEQMSWESVAKQYVEVYRHAKTS